MTSTERHERLEPHLRADIRALAQAIEDDTGAPPLNDQSLLQLAESRDGLIHLTVHDERSLVGYAQLDGDSAELAVREEYADELVRAVERAAGEALTVWTHGKHSPVAARLQAGGYRTTRVLHQLRMPLTGPIGGAPVPDGVEVRPFVAGADETAWLEVNAAAFAEHAEQGRWTLDDLLAREAEPWFDPAGFFLARRRDDLVGFHWTKIHPDGSGEVYVLAVAPAAQGLRLGAALLTIGLRHLAERGCPTVLLYVDESNSSALRLYEGFGFSRHDVDAQWRSTAVQPR
ncbi:MAG: mycothiol synthase [Jatrophihabitantaceae bacterium]